MGCSFEKLFQFCRVLDVTIGDLFVIDVQAKSDDEKEKEEIVKEVSLLLSSMPAAQGRMCKNLLVGALK